MRTKKVVALTAMLELGGCGDDDPPREPLVLAPGETGPFEVEAPTLELRDAARERDLVTSLWIPAEGSEPHPLIIFSHGASFLPAFTRPLLEHLASHGYVIAAPVHPFDNLNAVRAADPVDVGRNLENRPRDVSFIIDTLLARAADANDSLFGRIDGDRIGVIGHSYGGYTALAVAGGSLNGPEFEQFCAEDTITTDVFDTCSVYASVVEVDGPFPADTRNADPRVSAVVAMAPPIPFLGDGVADVETPVMVIAGEVDIPINYDRHVVAYFDALPPPRYLLSYETGGHLAMTTLCAFPRQDNTPNQDCAVYSRADKRFVTAMMGRHLRDVLAYDAELASFGEGPVRLETVR